MAIVNNGFCEHEPPLVLASMGEFLSHDPLLYVDSYNLFGFATYDPINGYDPYGMANIGFTEPLLFSNFHSKTAEKFPEKEQEIYPEDTVR